jgi:hypothetical protein
MANPAASPATAGGGRAPMIHIQIPENHSGGAVTGQFRVFTIFRFSSRSTDSEVADFTSKRIGSPARNIEIVQDCERCPPPRRPVCPSLPSAPCALDEHFRVVEQGVLRLLVLSSGARNANSDYVRRLNGQR